MTTYTPQQAREMMGRALDHGTTADVIESLAYQIEMLRGECDALKEDAERYRWLREQEGQQSPDPERDELMCCICVDHWTGSLGKTLSGEKMDFSIDAAMGKTP